MQFPSVHELGTFDIALPNKGPTSRTMLGPFLPENLAMHEDNLGSIPEGCGMYILEELGPGCHYVRVSMKQYSEGISNRDICQE